VSNRHFSVHACHIDLPAYARFQKKINAGASHFQATLKNCSVLDLFNNSKYLGRILIFVIKPFQAIFLIYRDEAL